MTMLSEQLQRAMAEEGMDQYALAKAAGVSQVTIHKLATGKSRSSRYLPDIAKALGRSVENLVAGTEKELTARSDSVVRFAELLQSDHLAKQGVPLVSWDLVSWEDGIFVTAKKNKAFGREAGEAVEQWVPSPMPERENLYALRVRSVSMEPRFREGEIIYIDPNERAESGRFVIVHDGEEAKLRQLLIEGREQFVKALNPSWPNPITPMSDDQMICGVVVFKGEAL